MSCPSEVNGTAQGLYRKQLAKSDTHRYNPRLLGAWLSPARALRSGRRGRRSKSARPDFFTADRIGGSFFYYDGWKMMPFPLQACAFPPDAYLELGRV
jgi:hypothetical protein